MIEAHETFDGTWPWAPRFSSHRGFDQHYVDEGPRGTASGGPMVLVHGEPTWGYLWRHLIGPLSEHRRVVVPDHMGFGKSADPVGRGYTAAEHVDNLTSLLVDELDLHEVTLVLHDWGGPIGTGFALRHPDRVRAVFATNTFLPLDAPGQAEAMAGNQDSAWFRWARAAYADGTLRQVLGQAGQTVTGLMLTLQTVTRSAAATPTWVRAYSAHYTDPAACEGAIRFPEQIVAADAPPPPVDAAAAAALRAKPAMLALGMHDTALLPQHVRAAFTAAYPNAPVVELRDAGHFPAEDAPEALLALIELFLQTT